MDVSYSKTAKHYQKRRRWNRSWKRITMVLASVVAFATTYALILPAITMEPEYICGREPHLHAKTCFQLPESTTLTSLVCEPSALGIHEHTTECYDENGEPNCGIADFVLHTHNSDCFDSNGELLCSLPEIKSHVHDETCFQQPHAHLDTCYIQQRGDLVCVLEEGSVHDHIDACYTQQENLICTLPETEPHTHTAEACYVETKTLLCAEPVAEAHTHSDSCYTAETTKICAEEETENHTHTDACFQTTSIFTCSLPETAGHVHSDACYSEPVYTLTCTTEETEGHTHSDACYETVRVVTCALEEGVAHIHTDSCYVCTPVLQCTELTEEGASSTLVCEKQEIYPHTHTDACFDESGSLICTQLQVLSHDHSAMCFQIELLSADTQELTCQLSEDENHTHTTMCYGQWKCTCGLSEHEHTEECLEQAEAGAVMTPVTETDETVPPDEKAGFALMALIPKNYLVEPTAIEGTELTWSIVINGDGSHTLRIDGTGEIPDYAGGTAPWNSYKSGALHISFGENVTRVGAYAMHQLLISSIEWGGVTEIAHDAFSYGKGPEALTIPGTVLHIGNYAFGYRSQMSSVILEEGIQTIETLAFATLSRLDNIHIPASVSSITGGLGRTDISYTVAEDNAYYCAVDGVLFTKDMTRLVRWPSEKVASEYRVPDTVRTIGNYAFAYAGELGRLIIPATVETLEDRFAQQTSISEVYFEDGNMPPYSSLFLYNSTALVNIRLPENTVFALPQLFGNNSTYSYYETLKIPNGVTKVGSVGGHLPNLKSVVYNAANASITSSKLFVSCSTYNLTIGADVDHLPAKFTGFVSLAEDLYFKGENTFTVESGAFTGAGSPVEGLSGKLYVDTQGVLYQCHDDGTATVVYFSPNVPSEVTIPATIITDDDMVYTVTSVGENSIRRASALTSLTFVAPEAITSISPYAMANCLTLSSVNGATGVEEAVNVFSVATIGANVFYNTGLEGTSGAGDMDGVQSLVVSRTGATDLEINLSSAASTLTWVEQTDAAGSGGYQLLTGDTMTITASVGNTNGNEDYVYRIYFRLTNEDGKLSIAPGSTYTFDDQSVICCATDDPNTVYLEFVPKIGKTAHIPVTAIYPSPRSAGGGLTIWGEILPKVNAGTAVSQVTVADKNIKAQWITIPDEFQLHKTASTSVLGIVTDGNGGAKPNGNLPWQIMVTRETETTSAYGKDYATSVDFVDIITFPDGISWTPAVLEAIKNGNVSRSGTTLLAGDTQVATLSFSGTGSSLLGVDLFWDSEQEQVSICWSTSNNSKEAEMNSSTLSLSIAAEAISIDMTKIEPSEVYTVNNAVQATVHYHYSSDVVLNASAQKNISGGNGKIGITKTSSGATYFGEDVTYTVDIYNNGGLPFVASSVGSYTLVDSLSYLSYISPENMERMFENYGTDLTITIQDAVLAPWTEVTGTDGTTSWQTSGNSDMGDAKKTLTITRSADGMYTVAVADGNWYTASTAATALKAAGYAVTSSDKYVCTWALNAEDTLFQLDSGTHRTFLVYATVKNSFQIISKDWPIEYPTDTPITVTNEARVENEANSKVTNASVSNRVKREAHIIKSVYKDGAYLGYGPEASDGDVLDYQLDFTHYGSGTYEDLPMVDDLYGSQYLLVPAVAANAHLNNLTTFTDEDGTQYYILTDGTYSDVTVGIDDEGNALIAATVTVKPANTDEVQVELGGNILKYSGIHTQIKWYFPYKPGEDYWLSVKYKALVDLDLGGLSYTLGNAVWMNDRTDTRIFDVIWGGGTIIDFEKHIVTEKGLTYTRDEVADYSTIEKGEAVTYRLTLSNTNNSGFYLSGDKLADALPETFGLFAWEKGSNVTGFRIETDNSGVDYGGLDNWYIGDSYNGMAGDQYILWPEDSYINFSQRSTIYLYFTLTYPDNLEQDTWNQYAASVNGGRIDNTLFVYRFPCTVQHDLRETGNVLLQKGVYGMYHYLNTHTSSYTEAGTSRLYYNNRDSKNRAVLYYVTLYNDGNKRLYLDELHDQLPSGFTYKQLFETSNITNTSPTSTRNKISTIGGTNLGADPLVTMNGGVVYRSATITATKTDSGVTFNIGAGTGNYAVRYDESRGQYYLNCGEAIVFGYVCDIGLAADTTDSATNVIAMPYIDYLDTGVNVITAQEMSVTASDSGYFLDNNDGSRQTIQEQQVKEQYAFPRSGENEWLLSDVTVIRGGIYPGVTKFTDSYTSSDENAVSQPYINFVRPTDTVNWRVSLHNSGTLSLTDYTFTDSMPAPYVFEGPVVFTIYDGWNNIMSEFTALTLPARVGEEAALTVTGTDGKSYTVPFDGTKVHIGGACALQMSLMRDVSGNEVLTLYCTDATLSIPEGGHVDVALSSRNPTKDYINAVYTNRATLQPNEQPFEGVGQGSMVKDDTGKSVRVENYSPVNVSFGYATSSEKRVTEDASLQNTAVSVDPTNNSIVLDSTDSTFTYTLSVSNDTDHAMTKLVVIDNLPEPGDHSPFDRTVSRNSAFTVHFAENPMFKVTVTTKDGTVNELSDSQFTVEYSTTTDFGGPQSNDWKGLSSGTAAKWTADPTGARAFRLIIRDSGAMLLPYDSKIEITFKAKADTDANPGEVAWNSFGYHYSLYNVSSELEAMPLVVGVAVPSVPSLKKVLVDSRGAAAPAEADAQFTFLIYQGTALTETYDTADAWYTALEENGRAYQTVTAIVEANAAESDPVILDFEDGWTWTNGQAYTVVELSADARYAFSRFTGANTTSYTFTYDPARIQTISCENALKEWSVELTKTDHESNFLSGAVFALYSPDQADQLSTIPAEYASLNLQQSIVVGDNTWYLAQVGTSGADGKLTFAGLLRDRCYLLEVKAPDGYNLTEGGQVLYQSSAVQGIYSTQIVNYPGYELPETGGSGSTAYRLMGSGMLLTLLILYAAKRRYRGRRVTGG